jgi:hypothetical protein
VPGLIALALSELESASVFRSVVLPLVVFLSLVCALVWLVLLFHAAGVDRQRGIQRVQNNAPVAPDDLGGTGGGDGC